MLCCVGWFCDAVRQSRCPMADIMDLTRVLEKVLGRDARRAQISAKDGMTLYSVGSAWHREVGKESEKQLQGKPIQHATPGAPAEVAA